MGLDDEVFVVEVEGDDDGVGKLVLLVDLRILGDDVVQLVLENRVQVTLYVTADLSLNCIGSSHHVGRIRKPKI